MIGSAGVPQGSRGRIDRSDNNGGRLEAGVKARNCGQVNQDCCLSVTREKTVKERRPLVNRVVRPFTEAIHYIKTNKEETKALIGKNLKSNDPEGWNALTLRITPPIRRCLIRMPRE